MKRIIFFAFVVFLFLVQVVSADIWISDSTGTLKRFFYQNDTIYLNSTILFTPGTTLRVYVVRNNNTWINQSSLTDVRGSYSTVTTHSSGAINKQIVWIPTMAIGDYDLVIDVNSNGLYDEGTCGDKDCVYHLTETGFSVSRTPKSVITASYGPHNPVNHNWAYDPNNPYNVMMQLKLTGDTEENVKISSIYLSGIGSGDDRRGVSIIRIVQDADNDGAFGTGDGLIAWGTYYTDDGIASLGFQSLYNLPANGTVYFLIIYTMSNYVKDGEMYAAKITDIETTGDLTKVKTIVNNLPLTTSTKTILASPHLTTTTTTATITTTTMLKDECSTKEDCKKDYCSEKKKYTYACEYDDVEKRKMCTSSAVSVKCCENNDCKEDERCVNYVCEKKPSPINFEMMIAIVSVIALGITIPILYFYFKSRKIAEYEYSA